MKSRKFPDARSQIKIKILLGFMAFSVTINIILCFPDHTLYSLLCCTFLTEPTSPTQPKNDILVPTFILDFILIFYILKVLFGFLYILKSDITYLHGHQLDISVSYIILKRPKIVLMKKHKGVLEFKCRILISN